ncbi:MAG TPA: hypothetical protein VNF73_07540 [Candidatus Saccharimonadales bacterium]|nr:hypothetical protein [Candidatus Saccharimonadales bacterium]
MAVAAADIGLRYGVGETTGGRVSSDGDGVVAPGGNVSNGGGVIPGVIETDGRGDGDGVGRGVGRGVGSGVGGGVGNGVGAGGPGVGNGRGVRDLVGSGGAGDGVAASDGVAAGARLGWVDSLRFALGEADWLADGWSVASALALGLPEGTFAVSAVAPAAGAELPSSTRPVTTCWGCCGAISRTNAATSTMAIATTRGPRSDPPRGVGGLARTRPTTACGDTA